MTSFHLNYLLKTLTLGLGFIRRIWGAVLSTAQAHKSAVYPGQTPLNSVMVSRVLRRDVPLFLHLTPKTDL